MTDRLASDLPFDEAERRVLRQVLAAMIPASGDRPSAADEVIFADFLATAAPEADTVRRLIERAREAGIAALARTQTFEVRTVVGLVVQCYYRDERVLRAIGAPPRPPFPEGHTLADDADDDWTLLDPVRARGQVWREV